MRWQAWRVGVGRSLHIGMPCDARALSDGRYLPWWIWLAGEEKLRLSKSVPAIHLVLVTESGEVTKKIIVHADHGFHGAYTMGSGRWHEMTSTAFFALI